MSIMLFKTLISRLSGRRYYKYEEPTTEVPAARQRRRLFRRMIRDRADHQHVRYRHLGWGVRVLWMVLASFLGIWFEWDRAQEIANERRGKVIWSPLVMVFGTCWTVASWMFLCSILFQINLQMPLYRRYQHTSIETIGKVVECERAVVKNTFKVVVVYRVTPVGHQAFYYAKVFFLKDLVEHANEEFPLLLLPFAPSSAATKRQMRQLRWYHCPRPWLIIIALSSIGVAWRWILSGPWQQNNQRLLWFLFGNTAVGLLLGYWRALDHNRLLLDGGAVPVPVELIPWLSMEMEKVGKKQEAEQDEEEMEEEIAARDAEPTKPPITNVLIPLASDDSQKSGHKIAIKNDTEKPATPEQPSVPAKESQQPDSNSNAWSWYLARKQDWTNKMPAACAKGTKKEWSAEWNDEEAQNDEEQILLLDGVTPAEDSLLGIHGHDVTTRDVITTEKDPASPDDAPVIDSLCGTLDAWPNRRQIRDDTPSQAEQISAENTGDLTAEYWPNQHLAEPATPAAANVDQSFASEATRELDLILMDATAEDTWAQQNLDTTAESELSLWDRLEKDYRGWLKSVHGISPEKFNEMSLADRLHLRGSYYNADDADNENTRRILIDVRAKREKRKVTKREKPKFKESPIAAAEAWLAQHAPQSMVSSAQASSAAPSLWDKLDKDYRKWLKSSKGIAPEMFNDMNAADRLQLRTSYYNADGATSSLLWEKLDKEYRKWLKTSHGMTPQKFEDLTTADRLQLRTSYYSADSVPSSLWDKLDNDYRKWLQSTHGITAQKFNAMSTASRLKLRTSYYNAGDADSADGDETTKRIFEGLRGKREESRKRRDKDKSKRPRRSRIANF